MKLDDKIIGGEFEIAPFYLNETKQNFFQDGFLYSSGRIALLEILTFIKNNLNISSYYFPDYLCVSIIEVAEHIGIKCNFFHLADNLTINKEDFNVPFNDEFAILLINYQGLCNLDEEVLWVKANFSNAIIIVDNVQSFFEMNKPTQADFTFTSFRKTFPVPDGSWVKTKYNDYSSKNYSFSNFVFYKLIGGLIKNSKTFLDVNDDIYLKLFKDGERLLETDYHNKSISPFSLSIFNNIDTNQVRSKRIVNALYLEKRLNETGIRPILHLEEGNVPLFVSILIENRDYIRKKLFEENIFCPVHWPIVKYREYLKMGTKMEKSELSLVIDQRYEIDDMERIINVIAKVL